MSKHLTNIEITACLDGRLSKNQKNEIKQHLDDCAACREKIKELESFSRDLTNTEVPQISEQHWQQALNMVPDSNNSKKIWSWVAAASILFLSALFWWPPFSNVPSENQLRSTNFLYEVDIYQPMEKTVLNKGGVFEWEKFEYAIIYRLSVYNSTGDLTWEVETTNNTVNSANIDLNTLSAGQTYYWQVEVIDGDGNIKKSPLTGFTWQN